VNAFGLSFDSELSFAAMVRLLTERGPWLWRERDSARHGNLASARTATLRLDLVASGGTGIGGTVDAGNSQPFSLSVRPNHDHPPSPDEWSALVALIYGDILATLGAARVQPTDPID
jgi:hypothetical protein